MGNFMNKKTKKENEYINKIKDYNVDSDEINTEITINMTILVKCIQEIIDEVEELQKKDKERIHMLQPKLDCMNFSLI